MKLKSLLFLAMFAFSAPVLASGSGTGTITNPTTQILFASPSQLFIFGISSPIAGTPACNTYNRFVVDITKPGGAATMKVVLAAYALGKTVSVMGTGRCDLFGSSEDAASVAIGVFPASPPPICNELGCNG